MALTGTNRGAGGNATSSTSWAISPTTNFTANSLAILAIVYDNSGAQGADSGNQGTSFTDSVGNTWSSQSFSLNDPGAANAGSILAIYTSNISTLTTTNSINLTFSVTVPAKAYTLTEVTTSTSGATIRPFPSGTTVGSSSTTTSVATPTITTTDPPLTGELLFAVVGREANGTRTGDADTTNGTWSTAQSAGFGTTTSGQEIISQFKVVTATGAQTYNPTFGGAAADGNIGYVRIEEVAPAGPSTSFDPMGMLGFFGM